MHSSTQAVKCEICDGAGIVIYSKIERSNVRYDFVAHCTCRMGDKYKINTGKRYVPVVDEVVDVGNLIFNKKGVVNHKYENL